MQGCPLKIGFIVLIYKNYEIREERDMVWINKLIKCILEYNKHCKHLYDEPIN
jgi:hypothetical protein